MWSKFPEIQEELKQVEEFIKKSITSKNKLLSDIVAELVEAGGKRLRPAFVILSAKFGKYGRGKILPLAGAFEVLHMATLVHDDVIDRSRLRRGKSTVFEKYGADMAIYTGDFLFTKAVLMLSKGVPAGRLNIAANAIKTICEGEVGQYQDRYNTATSVTAYLKRIARKTAVLFSASCALGAYTAKCSDGITKSLTKYGLYYGMAFQIRDDLNDFLWDAEASGKPVFSDIAKGIITLPVIYSMNSSPRLHKELEVLLNRKSFMSEPEALSVVKLVKESGGIENSTVLLKKYIQRGIRALENLPDNEHKNTLINLINDLKI